jgi:hypothetical protein
MTEHGHLSTNGMRNSHHFVVVGQAVDDASQSVQNSRLEEIEINSEWYARSRALTRRCNRPMHFQE